jgi:hypothetical protein
MNAFERELIPAGIRIHVVKSPRGSFIRAPDGRFFAIRQSISTMTNNPQPRLIAPQPPPPPPPPLPSFSLFDELLSGMIK